ncbi:MAG TPA: PIG-L deacetylase family protein, partial [Thermoanaerobaculia bacterium]|nr:PIG-L deacetylase family protein [Thermoanaerobaculia bacterium]
MLIEAETIPYEPAQLRGERLLVLAPHPDDEVIGCGGLVAQHLREKRVVRIVVATDGSQGGSAEEREQESRRALGRLGDGGELVFLRFPDRSFGREAMPRLRQALLVFHPDLILVPSPIEIHPDHLELARVFCDLVQSDDTLFADLATARVAFYEVGQPLRPNAIVDITGVAESKYAAIAEHASQLEQRDYV